jgi:alpha-beta hydrolase superfamily lysophospholipase
MHSVSQPDLLSPLLTRSVVCEDGYELRYRRWRAVGPAAGTIVLVNGMMSHSGWFVELAERLTALGFDVVGADRRGTGMNELNRGDAPSAQALTSDLRKIMEAEDRGLPCFLVGWSWGAVPAIHVALELGQSLNGLILLAPGLFPSSSVRQAVQEELASCDLQTAIPALRSPLTPEMFSDREDFREFIRHDSLTQHTFTPRFFRVAGEMSFRAIARLSQLKAPVLLLLAGADQTADNGRTVKAFQRLPQALVTTATLDCQHAMQFEAPDEIVANISRWLQCGTCS